MPQRPILTTVPASRPSEREAADDDFRCIGFLVFLPFDNGAGKDDVLEVKNSKAIVFHLFGGMQRDNIP